MTTTKKAVTELVRTEFHQHPDEAFAAACKFAEGILHRTIEYAISNAKAESRVMDAIQKTVGHTLVLPEYMPWVDAVFKAEREKENELWYIIFPSRRGGYSVQCIPDAPGSFGQRHPLPKDWWGNPKASGVEGCSLFTQTDLLLHVILWNMPLNLRRSRPGLMSSWGRF